MNLKEKKSENGAHAPYFSLSLIFFPSDDQNVGMTDISENKAVWSLSLCHLSKCWVTLPSASLPFRTSSSMSP